MSEYRKDFREFQREYYWSVPRLVFMGVLAVALLGCLGFGLRYLGYAQFAFFAPLQESVRRDVMIESRAYSEATTRRLYELKLQYDTSQDEAVRATIRAMALHEARAFDKGRLPRDLQIFIIQIGG